MLAKISLALLIALIVLTVIHLKNGIAASQNVIVFDESHGQYYDSDKLDMFISDLKKLYTVYINRNTITNKTLENAAILIMTNPKTGLLDSEVAAIKGFVERGGVLIVMGDWYKYVNDVELNKLTEDVGIKFTKTSVHDKQFFDYREYYPLVEVAGDSELSQFLKEKVTKRIKYSGCMLEISGDAKEILRSSKLSFVVDENGKTIKSGSVVVGAYSSYGKGYIIAIGSSKLASTRYFYENKFYDNRNFMLSLIEWAMSKTGARELPVKVEVDVKPTILPVGQENNITITVKLENVGSTLSNVKIKASSDYFSEEKVVDQLGSGEKAELVFEVGIKPSRSGPISIVVSVEAQGKQKTIETTIYGAEKGKTVIIDYSHGEYYGLDRMKEFVEFLSSYGVVAASNEEIDEKLLEYAKILVLPNPEKSFSYSEIKAIQSWVENGGILLVFGNYYAHFDPKIHNSLTSSFGIEWYDGSVRDESHSLENKPYAVFLSNFADNDLASAVAKGVEKVFFSGTSLKLSENAVPIVIGYDTTIAVDEEGNVLVEGKDVVVVAVSKVNKGVVIAIGGVHTILDSYYGISPFSTNKAFFEKLFEKIIAEAEETKKKEVYMPNIVVTFTDYKNTLPLGESEIIGINIINKGNGSALGVKVQVLGINAEVSKDGNEWSKSIIVDVGEIKPHDLEKISVHVRGVKEGLATVKVTVVSENFDPVISSADIEISPSAQFDYTSVVIVAVIIAAVVAGYLYFTKKKSRKKSKKKKK